MSGFTAQKLVPIAADGRFQAPISSNLFFLVSPEGIPLLYNLNPGTWEQSHHRIT